MYDTKMNKKTTWKWWWQTNKDEDNNYDCASSFAPSSLVVHHSIHSKESDDILSTASIKSKPWISQKLKSTISPAQDELPNNNKHSTSSLLLSVPSITSSTVPVINFDQERKKNTDLMVFFGIKAKFGKWVNRDKCNNNNEV